MRHLFILLALFLGVAAMSPYFWVVLGMNFGAAKIGAERPDGTMEWSIMGPSAPWPDWMPEVDGAKLTVGSYAEPSDGYPASGLGYLRPQASVAALQRNHAAKLASEGWEVEVWVQTTSNGRLPPSDIRICTITAKKGAKSFWVTFFEGEEAQSRIVWRDGGEPYPSPLGAEQGNC